jgi:hypothetical protein
VRVNEAEPLAKETTLLDQMHHLVVGRDGYSRKLAQVFEHDTTLRESPESQLSDHHGVLGDVCRIQERYEVWFRFMEVINPY